MENRDSSHPASHDLIVEGARQNNLKNISLRIPHNQVTAITGLSGSGKSSLAFDTLLNQDTITPLPSIPMANILPQGGFPAL